jgi:L-seryl-tRNA(Ser) seleniumtransferase
LASTPTRQQHPPSVKRVIDAVGARVAVGDDQTAAVREIARAEIALERERTSSGERPRSVDDLADAVVATMDRFVSAADIVPMPVINATGIIVHTNLGRAPWPDVAIEAAARAGREYGYLELDQATGRRGPRYRLAEDHLVALTGADDALVVNNNAAAVAVAVGLAGRGGVLVSRGELVEIGGGVRIPEIIRRTGARLLEVGTTNRTRATDFEPALADGNAKLVLRVHPSNFAQTGFVEAPDPTEVAAIAHGHGAIVLDDLGSGAFLDTADYGLAHEPTPRERLDDGADLVMFSGDKLVGGPQAGLMVGRADLIARCRRDPLARAMRPDKTILAGVAATLGSYRAGLATERIPVWRSIARSKESLRERAARIERFCAGPVPGRVKAIELASAVGGGSLPGQTLPSWGIAVAFASPNRAAAVLRTSDRPIVTMVADGVVQFDLRTVEDEDDAVIVEQTVALAGSLP